jgi:membrane-bound lytic murein transglycosylase B
MVLENYTALLAYNPAQAYALSVCALGDAIAGGLGLVQPWPIGEAALSRNEKRNVQIALSALGYDTFGADGLMGPNTAAALWRYQRDQGYVADAYLSRALWAELAG